MRKCLNCIYTRLEEEECEVGKVQEFALTALDPNFALKCDKYRENKIMTKKCVECLNFRLHEQECWVKKDQDKTAYEKSVFENSNECSSYQFYSEVKEMELKVTKEKVLEAAKECSEARRVLKTLFPEVFKERWKRVRRGDKFTNDGRVYVVTLVDRYPDFYRLIAENNSGTCWTFDDIFKIIGDNEVFIDNDYLTRKGFK